MEITTKRIAITTKSSNKSNGYCLSHSSPKATARRFLNKHFELCKSQTALNVNFKFKFE